MKSVNGSTPTNGNVTISMPKVEYPIPMDKGGTDATTGENGFSNLANSLSVAGQGTGVLDTDNIPTKQSNKWFSFKAIYFFDYIKRKLCEMNGWIASAMIANGAISNVKIGETISLAKGGTGATTNHAGFMSLANGLTIPGGGGVEDEEKLIYKNTSGTNWGIYTFSTLWTWIRNKINSMTGWITAGMCGSGSNLYMHYVSLYEASNKFIFSFPSTASSTYTSLGPLLADLHKATKSRRFPCNGVVKFNQGSYAIVWAGTTSDIDNYSVVFDTIDSDGYYTSYTIKEYTSNFTILDSVVSIIKS